MLPASEVEFRRATLALAATAADQIALFPPFVCFGDELVIDWSEALSSLRRDKREFTGEEEEAITDLDRVIVKYSGPQNERLFRDAAALSDDPRWTEIRIVAVEVCRALRWPVERPWPSGATYVSGTRKSKTANKSPETNALPGY